MERAGDGYYRFRYNTMRTLNAAGRLRIHLVNGSFSLLIVAFIVFLSFGPVGGAQSAGTYLLIGRERMRNRENCNCTMHMYQVFDL